MIGQWARLFSINVGPFSSNVVLNGPLFSTNMVPKSGCFWAKRFMFSVRYIYKSMQKWHLDIGEMLTYVSDVLCPHGFDEIVKDDFAAFRQMLQGNR
jgi:hypothetical protein